MPHRGRAVAYFRDRFAANGRTARAAGASRLRLALAWVVLAGIVALGFPSAARAAPLDLGSDDWEGLSDLVRMAQAEFGPTHVVPTHDLDLGRLVPADTLVLIHPTRELDVDELNAFMTAGGRIILLDDYGTGDALLGHFGVRRVPLPEHPAEMLRSNPAFAVAEAVSSHRAVQDVTRVATNHATGLSDRALAPLLVVRGHDEPDVLLAVAGVVGRGRLLAVGDASVAMNSMLRYPGNHALGVALLRYAADTAPPSVSGGEGADAGSDEAAARPTGSGGTVYLLANDFVLSGRAGDHSALSDAGRAVRGAFDSLKRGASPTAAYVASLAVALAVIAWTSLRAGRVHKATLPQFARPIPVAAQGGVAGHAAVLGAPATSRALVMLELKSALEEAVASKLGLERVIGADDLVARARAAGWLGESDAQALAEELARLSRFAAAHIQREQGFLRRVGDAEVAATARRVRRLVEAVESASRGKVEVTP
jgi:hypothetical protein